MTVMTNANKINPRKFLKVAELDIHKDNNTILMDDRRNRPLWFDGRFLDASTLTSEQNYFLSRQADIARVAGVGVVNGLMVNPIPNKSRSVQITSGHGITPSGELVTLTQDLNINLGNIEETEKLDASFGLSRLPRQSYRNRSGLFIIALRPVEYTAEPITSYPTSIKANRSVEDGSVIEATAVTLIPYPEQGSRTELRERQKHVAYEIFINGSKKGQPLGVLPLAMVAINLGVIEWIDPYLVRREVGAAEHDIFGLGISPKVLREAFLLQYQNHLKQILGSDNTLTFPASEHFSALPPAGPMPASTINPESFTQKYFPAEMDVELSFVPEDELPSILEESFSLPPIDLSLKEDELESTSILVMIPIPRHRVRKLSRSLKSTLFSLKPIALNLNIKRRPLSTLSNLRSFGRVSAIPDRPITSTEEVWRELLSGADQLWYTRRRNISYKREATSLPRLILRDETETEEKVTSRVNSIGLRTEFNTIFSKGTIAGRADIHSLFGSKKFSSGSKLIMGGAINELKTFEKVNRFAVSKVSERFSENKLGEGIARLEKADETFTKNEELLKAVSTSGKVPELDQVLRVLPEKKLGLFSKNLKIAANSGNVSDLIIDKLDELKTLKKIR